MPNLSRARRLIAHPVTGGLAVLTAFLGALKLGWLLPLWAWFVANSPTLFSVSAIFGFTIAPEIEGLPAGPIVGVAIVTGITAGLWKLRGPARNLRDRLT